MEILIYGIVTLLSWLAFTTVLLPFVLLLKISKRISQKWFSFVYTRVIIPSFNPNLTALRKRTLDFLKESKREDSPTEILEIGVAGGFNLPYYPRNSVLTALDVNKSFETYFRKNQKKFRHIAYKKTIHGMAEDMREVEDSSMDVVLGTFVLCSVDDVMLALSEIKRVLKPGGKYLFLEHVAFPKSHWGVTMQKMMRPLWKTVFAGCHLDRETGDSIRKAGFSDVSMERTYPPLMLYVRAQIIGMATK